MIKCLITKGSADIYAKQGNRNPFGFPWWASKLDFYMGWDKLPFAMINWDDNVPSSF